MRGASRPSYFGGYPAPVANVLGLLGIAVFIATIIGLAMCVTWLVVKVSPMPGRKKQKPKPAAETAES